MSERRHRFRAATDRRVRWRPSELDEDWRTGTLMDISTGGARIRSRPAPIHHWLTLSLGFEELGPSLVASAELVRIEAQLENGDFSWAVSFRGLDADAQARLTRFVFAEARRAAEQDATEGARAS